MENEPADYLQIPITDHERAQEARRRSRSNERLLPETESVYSQPFEERDDDREPVSPLPTRFPSVRGDLGQPRRFHSFQGGQYAAISPIDEEDIADVASEVPSRPRTIPQSEKSFEPLVPLPDLWTPVWLRRSTLAAFIVFFTLSIVALIVLWVLSATHNGFEVHFDGPHHAWWVYIPTIAVVLLVGLWRQVDYHTKALIPWDELQRGPIPATKSLLLNYVSPLQIVALFEAFVHNHIPIVATVSSFILLKLITVFSTGLFILLPKTVSQDGFPLLLASQFDGTGAGSLDGVASAPVGAFYANAYQGVPLPPGVDLDKAYTPFYYDQGRDEKLADNATFSADVDGFVPIISCQTVDARLDGDATKSQTQTGDMFGQGIRFSVPADDKCDSWPAVTIPALNPEFRIAPRSQIYGTLQTLACGQDEAAALLFTVVDLSFEQQLREGTTQFALAGQAVATTSSRTVNDMTSIICEASYTIATVHVSNDTTQSDTPSQGIKVIMSEKSTNRTLDGFSDSNLRAAFQAVMSAASGMFGEVEGADATSGTFPLLALHSGSRDVSQLKDADTLREAAEGTFKGVMAHFANQRLSQPLGNVISGRAERQETRYVVNDPSAALMIGAMTVAMIAAGILLVSAPRAVVPRDPGSVAATAAVLTNSLELNRLLRRGGVPSDRNAEAALDGYEFGTAIATNPGGQSSFKIVTSEGVKDHNAPIPNNNLRWWHPLTSSLPFVVLVFALPIALIGLLEYTQRRSEDGGIVNVPDNQATDIYTHYIPSLVMIIVASLVNLIDFNVAVFAPYSELAKGAATHRKSLLSHYLGVTPVWAVFQAVQVRHLNVILSTLAAIVASILAIVAAGLYNVGQFESVGADISLRRADRFNLLWDNSAITDGGAAATVNSVLHNNMTWPQFTNRTLALPTFAVDAGDLSTGNSSTRATPKNGTEIEIDALEADLQCFLVDRNFIDVEAGDSTWTVEITSVLPDSCNLAGSSREGSFVTLSYSFNSSSEPVLFGRQNDLLFGNGTEFIGNILNSTQQNLSSLITDNPAVGCPSLVFTYGRISEDSTAADITSMLCYQRIAQVSASFSLKSNTTAIDNSQPMSVDQSDAEALSNPLSTEGDDKVFNFRIQKHLQSEIQPFTRTSNSEMDFDAFFQGALNTDLSPDNPEFLIGEANESALLRSIMLFYRIYMAQAISLNMRAPLSSSNDSSINTSTSKTLLSMLASRQADENESAAAIVGRIPTTITTPRLVQSRTTKILLQALLGLTSILGLAGWLLTRFRRVLPVNPLSIAGAMSLLAGSDIVHSVDDGRCECCGKLRRNSFGAGDEVVGAAGASVSGGHGPGGSSRSSGVGHARGGSDSQAVVPEIERPSMIPSGAEWLLGGRRGAWGMIFAGRRYSSGWWREDVSRGRRRRWGIDIGERADGNADADWELGRRKLRRSQAEGTGMRFEGSPARSVGRSVASEREAERDVGVNERGRQGVPPAMGHESLDVPRESGHGYGYGSGYGDGGLRGEPEDDGHEYRRSRSVEMPARGSSDAGSREASFDVGEGGGDSSDRNAGALNFSRGGYRRVEGGVGGQYGYGGGEA